MCIGSYEDEVVAAKIYDACYVAIRGADAAYKSNFPGMPLVEVPANVNVSHWKEIHSKHMANMLSKKQQYAEGEQVAK